MYNVLPMYKFVSSESDNTTGRSGDGTMPIRKIYMIHTLNDIDVFLKVGYAVGVVVGLHRLFYI